MENDDFETILTVKEFDSSCTFYQGLLPDLKICVASNFMMKFKLPYGKTFKLHAVNDLLDKTPHDPQLLELKFKSSELEHAAEFLMQNNIKFIAENNTIRTMDPDGNMLIIAGSENCDLSSVKSDRKTRKVKIS